MTLTVRELPDKKKENLPQFAILGYQGNKNLTLHKICNGKLQPEIAFTKKNARRIFKALYINNEQQLDFKFKGLIPKNILCCNLDRDSFSVVWIADAKQRYLEFSDNKKSGLYPNPKLIFIYKRSNLHVYAVKKGVVNEETQLYKAPYPNIYSNGSVCMGNVKISVQNFTYIDDVVSYLEQAFFQSVFTSHNDTKLLNILYVNFLKEHKDTNQRFNDTLLLKTDLQLNDIIL